MKKTCNLYKGWCPSVWCTVVSGKGLSCTLEYASHSWHAWTISDIRMGSPHAFTASHVVSCPVDHNFLCSDVAMLSAGRPGHLIWADVLVQHSLAIAWAYTVCCHIPDIRPHVSASGWSNMDSLILSSSLSNPNCKSSEDCLSICADVQCTLSSWVTIKLYLSSAPCQNWDQ